VSQSAGSTTATPSTCSLNISASQLSSWAHAPEEGVVMEQMVQEVRFAEAGVLQWGKSCLGPLSEVFLRKTMM
jgi:hypothetical protein